MQITCTGSDGPANAQQLFQKIDTDGDGRITKDEMKASAPKGGSRPGPSIDSLFSQIDTDGDGGIDETENQAFLESAKSRRHGPPDAAGMARKMFEKADSNGDGKITKEELEAALPRHDSSEALERLFTNADSDEDGAISQSELEAQLKAHFEHSRTTYSAAGGRPETMGARLSRTA